MVKYDMAFAIEKAELYSKQKYKDFEKEFLPGCFKAIKGFVYLIYFLLAFFAVVFPINEYHLGHISGWGMFMITIGYTFPLFYGVYKTIVDENYFTRRIWKRSVLKKWAQKLKSYNTMSGTESKFKKLKNL